MAGSRKALLKKISPHKGTGRYIQYLRCALCGKLARGPSIGHAGSHQLTVSQCIRKLPGYRTGWEWGHREPDREMLGVLEESLERALAQVREMLGKADEAVPPQEVLAEYHLLPQVASEWVIPGSELEVFCGGEEGEEDQEGEVVHPARVRLDRV